MTRLIFGLILATSLNTFARPLHCVVSFIDGDQYQDFIAEKQNISNAEFTQYALTKNDISFFANESKQISTLNLVIIENGKNHLGTSPILNQKGQRACLTIDLGPNEKGFAKKISISCEAL